MRTTTMTPERTQRRAGFAGDVLRSAAADLLRLRKWSVSWILAGIWLLLNVAFSYVFGYITYLSGSETFASEGESPQQLLAEIMPSGVANAVVLGIPMFGSAIMMVLGALTTGSGYGWGTWKTVFTRGTSRVAALAGTLLTVALAVVGLVLATFVVDLAISVLLALIEGQSIALPPFSVLAQSIGGAILMGTTAALFGAAIGVLTRSPAVGIGIGLVWWLVVENLLRGVGSALAAVGAVADVLPGGASGSLAGAIAGLTEPGSGDGTPGISTAISGGAAVAVLAGWLLLSVAAGLLLIHRRDVT